MKTAFLMVAAVAMAATAGAQTRSGSGTAPAKRSGAMTINQASGGGKPHAPRTARQPTRVAPHPSAGTANRPHGGAHATTSRGMSGVGKGPQAKPTPARR